MSVRTPPPPSREKDGAPLVSVYFAKREDMRRFFVARLGASDQADDLVQELYLKVAAAGEPSGLQSPVAYLYRLASNLMLDRLRQQRRSVARDDSWYRDGRVGLAPEVEDRPDPNAALEARQTLEGIVRALQALPPQTRRVFELYKFEGLSHPEVAAKLGISRSAVEKHVSAALKHLLAMRP